jgi:hypothetical protein
LKEFSTRIVDILTMRVCSTAAIPVNPLKLFFLLRSSIQDRVV